jgi:POT family proton-dependent oligopeptide transporter
VNPDIQGRSEKMSLFNSITFRRSQPHGVLPIFFIQMVSTLGYSILSSTLVLFAKYQFNMDVASANRLIGAFIAFNYALHLLGGYWGGRYFSNRILFCIGMVCQFMGSLCLSTLRFELFNIGLALFLTGAGINVTCLSAILTQRFKPDDSRRETAFIWNYSGMNFGFLIGFTLSGFFQLSHDYHHLFLFGCLANVLAISFCLFTWRRINDSDTHYMRLKKTEKIKASAIGLCLIAALPLILSKLLDLASLSNKLVLITGIMIFLYCFYFAKKLKKSVERNKMLALIALMMAGVVFWTLYQISPMGLTVFIQNNVQREFDFGVIPPQWFLNVNTICIIAGGPLLAMMLTRLRRGGFKIHLTTQFSLALLCIGIAFLILPLGIIMSNDDGLTNPSWIVLSYILQSVGELLISPIGYAMVGALAPPRIQGIMLGTVMLCTGVGASLSSYSSNMMILDQNTTLALVTNPGYSRVFLALGALSLFCAAVLIKFSPKLNSLVYGETDSKPSNNPAPLTVEEKKLT